MASFWLEYTENGQRREFSFDSGSVSIGRDKASDFVLDHPTVSRQHALIVSNHNGYQLVVLSRGGLTAIDGGQVSGEVQLYDGSEIHFGQLSFTFRSPNAPPKPAGQQQQNWNQPSGAQPVWNPAQSGPQQGMPQQQQQPPQQQQPQQGGWDPGGWGDQPASSGGGGGGGNWQPSGALQSPSAFIEPAGGTNGSASSSGGMAAQESDDGLVSWDQIAASAEEEERIAAAGGADRDAYTDFERIQQAQAKADAQTKGNPMLVFGAILVAVGLLAFSFWPSGGTELNVDNVDVDDEKAAFIEWTKGDIECVGEAACRKQAVKAYNVAMKTLDQQDADIVNLYVSYSQLDRARLLLEKGGISKAPKEIANLEQNMTAVKTELDRIFQQRRINYREYRTRKMYRDMAGSLDSIKAYFPDKRCRYHQWALEKEREMKDQGIYPRRSSL